MKAVILAGGLGTRMREETEFRPKPMVELGGKPVLWHIMQILAAQGISEFVICTGYKGQMINEYFLNYAIGGQEVKAEPKSELAIELHVIDEDFDWRVTLVDTGPTTMTGGRIHRARPYIGNETFLVTYGDGLANVDIQALQEKHRTLGSIATLTSARPRSRFGVLDIDSSGYVKKFTEKPLSAEWVNIGYMLAEPLLFEYLNNDCVLEQEPLARLSAQGKLGAFKHSGFWQPMDTLREAQSLDELWNQGSAPWKVWN